MCLFTARLKRSETVLEPFRILILICMCFILFECKLTTKHQTPVLSGWFAQKHVPHHVINLNLYVPPTPTE